MKPTSGAIAKSSFFRWQFFELWSPASSSSNVFGWGKKIECEGAERESLRESGSLMRNNKLKKLKHKRNKIFLKKAKNKSKEEKNEDWKIYNFVIF